MIHVRPNNELKVGAEIKVRVKLPSNKNLTYKVSYEKANQLIQDRMAVIVHSTLIRKIYNSETLREFIFKRDGYRCVYCGRIGTTLDHIIPKHLGGRSNTSNLACSCRRCNVIKSDLHLEEFLLSYEPNNEALETSIEQILLSTICNLKAGIDTATEGIKIMMSVVPKEEADVLIDSLNGLILSASKLRDKIKPPLINDKEAFYEQHRAVYFSKRLI